MFIGALVPQLEMSVWFLRQGLSSHTGVTRRQSGPRQVFVVWGSLGLRSMLKMNRRDSFSSSTWFITCQNVLEKKAREGGRKTTTAEENIIFLAAPQLGCQWCFKVAGTFPNPISLNIISSSYLMLTVLLPHFPDRGRDNFCITRTQKRASKHLCKILNTPAPLTTLSHHKFKLLLPFHPKSAMVWNGREELPAWGRK